MGKKCMVQDQRQNSLPLKPAFRKLAVLVAVALTFFLLYRLAGRFFAQPEADLITWDQAARAEEAVGLAKEIHFHQPVKFVGHVLSLNWWPPLHHLIMLIFMLFLGPGFKAVIFPSFVAWFFSVFSILFVYKNVSPGNNGNQWVEYSLLFSLAILSPFLLSSATWAMLEIFGILLTYLAFGLYFKATTKNDSRAMRICGLTAFLLWTLKYSYGLFLSAVLFLSELERADQLRPKELFSRRRLRLLSRPILYPAYFLSMLIISIAATGGIRFRALGVRVSLTSIYNPAMYLYQYLFLVALFCIKKGWSDFKGRLRPGQRELLIWGALPTAVFLFLPDKIKAIIMNLKAGQRVELRTPVNSFYHYVRSVITDYSLFWPIGIFVLIMLCLALANWRKTRFSLRLLIVYSFLGFFATSVGFGLLESRYVATFVPALWIVAAWSSGFVLRKAPGQLKKTLALLILIPTAIAAVHLPILINKAIRQPWAPWAHFGIEYRAVIEPVIQQTQGAQRVLILGASDLGFVPLLSWKMRVAQFENPDFYLLIDPPDFAQTPGAIFLEKVALAKYDTVILFIVERGRYERPLREWLQTFAKSEKFRLLKTEFHPTPIPCQILFFARLTFVTDDEKPAFTKGH